MYTEVFGYVEGIGKMMIDYATKKEVGGCNFCSHNRYAYSMVFEIFSDDNNFAVRFCTRCLSKFVKESKTYRNLYQ